jgi:hypothetical protein
MDKKVALLVIYNHRFDRNIPIVQKLYSKRFSNIYHIVPFFDGVVEDASVIPVYESSYNFQGYISQAYTHIKGKGFTHYLIIADDMIINPKVDENSIWDVVGIGMDECFVPASLKIFQKMKSYWSPIWDALTYKVVVNGVEIKNILPSKEFAEKRFHYYNIPTSPIPFSVLLRHYQNYVLCIKKIPWKRHLDYPLVGCYSDTLFITDEAMDDFCTYCGAFAATNLFVEVAVPTALILSSDKVKFDEEINLHYGAYWPNTIHELDRYNYNLEALMNNFPEEKFFIHPVKLSKWK